MAVPGGNTLTVQTATGKVLSATVAELPTKGIAEFDRLPVTERKPTELEPTGSHGRRGQPPAGTLVSRVYMRGFDRDSQGNLHHKEQQSRRYSGPQRDFLWLKEAEWKALIPSNPSNGDKFPVPERIATRIFCNYLFDGTAGVARRWASEHIRDHELTVTIERVRPTGVRLRLEGFVRMTNNADLSQASRLAEFGLLGFLNYDPTKEAFDRFDIVALGDYAQPETKLSERFVTLGIAFELATPDSLGYGTPPHAIRDGDRPSLVRYFGTDNID